MSVGREHFIRHGLGGAVAEKIADDAGYSRGALYSNFNGTEELFLAVIREEQDRRPFTPCSRRSLQPKNA
jgi:AcrR family transcriptional regulator